MGWVHTQYLYVYCAYKHTEANRKSTNEIYWKIMMMLKIYK